MTGVEAYNEKYQKLAESLLKKHNGNDILSGYYYYILNGMSCSSAYTYLGYISNFLETLNGKNASEIKLIDYNKYMASHKTQTPSYHINLYNALKKFSRYLKASGICNDYMESVQRPKYFIKQESKKKREKKYLNKEEIGKYILEINDSTNDDIWKQRDLTMIILFLTSGIRCSALQKLDVKDVDVNNNYISVTEKRDEIRKIYLSSDVIKEIKKWLVLRNEYGADDDGLFISKFHKRMTNQSIYNIVTKYGKNIKNKNISPHALRASFGTNLYEATGDVYFVQQCMGHQSPKTTEIYIRGQNDKIGKRASAIMDSIVGL